MAKVFARIWGLGASHGTHKKHRSPGSIGACATPGRVFKGVRMAGQMGARRVTTMNLEVVEGDAERGLLLVRGSVPGPSGSLVFIRNAAKVGPGGYVPPVRPAAAEPEVESDAAAEATAPEPAEATAE